MSEIISLLTPSALDIHDNGSVYHGGDQEWFAQRWQRQAGCGPTNCANLLWHLAQTSAPCQPLCGYDAAQKAGFIQLMDDVWHYVTPGRMGVNTTEIFTTGAKNYAKAKGVALTTASLDIAPLASGARVYADISAFVAQGLAHGLPVAFLNLSNGALHNLDSWHWVTIAALQGGSSLIYDQGEQRWVDLQKWCTTSVMGGGFATLQLANL